MLNLGATEAHQSPDLVVGDPVLGDEPPDVPYRDVQPRGQFGDVEEVVVEAGGVKHRDVLLVTVWSYW
jgi:hypothetical protein